jgi:hypothetical protein
MRALIATIVVLVAACETVHTHTRVTVAPEALRAAIAAPETTASATVRDDAGNDVRLDRIDGVLLPEDPPLAAKYTGLAEFTTACKDPSQPCELEQRHAHIRLQIRTGTEHHLETGKIASGLLIGGVAGGEVYCFAKCSTAVKITLGAVDVASIVFFYMMWRIVKGLAN